MEKETLNEAAEKYAENKSSAEVFQEAHIIDFKSGANWQFERMYSEEDLEYAFNSGKGYGVPDNIKDFNSFINSLNKQD